MSFFVALLVMCLMANGVSAQAGQGQDVAQDPSQDANQDMEMNDPNLVNPQNKQGYGRNVPVQVKNTAPSKSGKSANEPPAKSISEQTHAALLQFGVLVAVSLLVGVLFFVNIGIELLLDKIFEKLSKLFGSRHKDEEIDPAALVGTFKRYK